MHRLLSVVVLVMASCHTTMAFAPITRLPTPTRTCSVPTAQPVLLDGAVGAVASSLFRSSGRVPILQSFGLQAVLFAALSKKVNKSLTPTGFAHAVFLATTLWTTLGWKGWTVGVAFFALGQVVTKVKFAEKEEMGIAEARGGRRGPENVW